MSDDYSEPNEPTDEELHTMTPNERPTPEEIADHKNRAEFLHKHGAPLDWVLLTTKEVSDIKQTLAERTEERDTCNTAYRLAKENQELLIAQRDTALAKLAKCREALELFDLGVGFGVTEEMYDKRKSALEETK